MFMVPYILVMYVKLKFQLDIIFICIYIPLYFELCMFRVLLHPSSGAQLQLSTIGVCNGFGLFIHYTYLWLKAAVVLLRMCAIAPETCTAQNREE
jgi:predicted Abi (CAAX) family protease